MHYESSLLSFTFQCRLCGFAEPGYVVSSMLVAPCSMHLPRSLDCTAGLTGLLSALGLETATKNGGFSHLAMLFR